MSTKEPAYIKRKKDAARKRQEAEAKADGEHIVNILDDIGKYLRADDRQARRADRFHRLAEKLSLSLERRKYWTEVVTGTGIWAAAIIAIVAVLDTRHSTDKQLAAMGGQQRLMQNQLDQMQAQQRPWVAVGVTLDRPLFFSNWNGNKQLLVPLKFMLKNYGPSPAVNIRIFAELHPHPGNSPAGQTQMDTDQKRECVEARKQVNANATGGITVFPGDTQSVSKGVGFYGIDNPTLYSVQGCVDYTYSRTLHGQTGFRMLLGKIRDNVWGGIAFLNGNAPWPNYIPPPGSNLPAPTIAMMPIQDLDFGTDPIGGNYAE